MAAPATSRLARSPACLSCLRRATLQPAQPSILAALTQTRARSTTSRAELEELQGIPVRLLEDVVGFGRKDLILRVKPGRMRNQWFPKGLAEYMTAKRFKELGLTQSSISPRDRQFGAKVAYDPSAHASPNVETVPESRKKKELLTLPPEETHALLASLLPPTLIFQRKPISAPKPAEPVIPRSPSLAAHAATSLGEETEPEPVGPIAIFGSVSAQDIVTKTMEILATHTEGNRAALDVSAVTIHGLEEGEDRIKRIGKFEVEITAGKDLDPVHTIVEVVPEE